MTVSAPAKRGASRRAAGPAPRAPRIELICVGTELLSGQVNTHQSYISLQLRAAGLELSRESSLPDDEKKLAQAVAEALSRSDAVILSGGLGPTFDDLTREAVASALGRPLCFHPELWNAIVKKFARYRIPVPEENKRQAFLIDGAEALENRTGSAPGQLLRLPRRQGPPQIVALLPGPAAELMPMFERSVLPPLVRSLGVGRHAASLALRLSGVPESVADEKLSPVLALAGRELSFTILASLGQVDFHARAVAATPARARALIAKVRRLALRQVGEHVFGEGPQTLESSIGDLLRTRRLSLAVAESCTGGMVGAKLTSTAGSSDYFLGGVLSYADAVKTGLLGVRPETLRRHGAVSARCAREMAEGVRKACGAKVGLAVTGIAGPGGGTAAKPVGLIFIAVCGPERARVWRLRLSGTRELIRQRAAGSALHLLRRSLTGRSDR